MTYASTKRLRRLAATTAFAVTASACGAGSDEASSDPEPDPTAAAGTVTEPAPAITATPTTTSTTTDARVEPEEESTPATDPPATTAASETAGVDIASFEQFALPDYAAAALGEGYSSYLVEVEPGIVIHVLEVGSGYPVYLQHGAPTSGFLYRKIAELLPPDQFRVIMPTMVGLGFSSQVPAEQHTLENHAGWINEVLNQLDLDELIYVGHDWGGPVGLGALARSPELLEGAVLLNTALGAPTGPVELNPQLQGILAPLPPEAELAVSVAIFDQLPGAQNEPDSLSSNVLDLYRRPVAESGNPIGPLSILRMAATGPEHPTAEVLRAIDAYTAQLDVPAEIVWGLNDPILGGRLSELTATFPNAPVTETNSGHFLQEEGDSPDAIAAAIQRVFEQVDGS